MLPSFSTEAATGSEKTSVWIVVGSTPGRCQKLDVSVSHRFTATIQSSFSMALRFMFALAPPTAGFCPQAKKPLMLPAYMASKSVSQE